ncbi:hypothetical protein BKA62DRAFT_486859 [Auriculariales sp. MPI-PUGE-AT-0066]|nr:hypothetical protein BKA62DRAFT_486859 [Auriculariales sp. MPI-PUGE-AT-0066]
MSAYGAISRPSGAATTPLPTLIYALADASAALAAIHIPAPASRYIPDELSALLHETFEQELALGRTYPQEGPFDDAAFKAYFGGADLIVGVLVPLAPATTYETTVFPDAKPEAADDAIVTSLNLEQARAGRPWADCVVGSYYIKPNYPGRSSHNCNAGFLVRATGRGKGYGKLLGRSYLRFAPALGYRGSVFNLVYVNNVASVRIWEQLGFEKVGRIPQAGRLRTADGTGEEYVDAWVIWKSFV